MTSHASFLTALPFQNQANRLCLPQKLKKGIKHGPIAEKVFLTTDYTDILCLEVTLAPRDQFSNHSTPNAPGTVNHRTELSRTKGIRNVEDFLYQKNLCNL
jgi:hypothetical protein